MACRLSLDTVESLNVTLQNLEQGAGAAFDRSDMAELKRTILKRIAELEIQALASAPASYAATSQFPNEPVVLPYACPPRPCVCPPLRVLCRSGYRNMSQARRPLPLMSMNCPHEFSGMFAWTYERRSCLLHCNE
jgi:hypothetical protein